MLEAQKRNTARNRGLVRRIRRPGPKKQPQMGRVYNQLLAIFAMSHNAYFTTYTIVKPGYMNNRGTEHISACTTKKPTKNALLINIFLSVNCRKTSTHKNRTKSCDSGQNTLEALAILAKIWISHNQYIRATSVNSHIIT